MPVANIQRGSVHIVARADIGAVNGGGRLALPGEEFEPGAVSVEEFQGDATALEFERKGPAQSTCCTGYESDHPDRS